MIFVHNFTPKRPWSNLACSEVNSGCAAKISCYATTRLSASRRLTLLDNFNRSMVHRELRQFLRFWFRRIILNSHTTRR